jgi:hypothetical protein
MKFKTMGLSAIAASTVIASSTAITSPVQAAGLTGQLDFTWNADATPTSIEFYTFANTLDDARGDVGDFLVTLGTGSFSALAPVSPPSPPTQVQGVVKDLPLIPVPGGSPISKWLDFSNDLFDFTLTSFTNTSDLQYKFEGFFSDGTLGKGEMTTQISGPGTKSYSTTITAVPTPVLLPGLIGLGLAAIRKRKAKASQAVGVEA